MTTPPPRPPGKRHSLRDKLFRGQVLAILTAVTLLCLVGAYSMTRVLFDAQQERMKLFAHSYAEEIQTLIDERASILGRVETFDYHRRARDIQLASHFAKFAKVLPALSYLDEEGREQVKVVRGKTSDELQTYDETAWFSQAMEQKNTVLITPLAPLPELGEPGINLINARIDYFGDVFQGVLKASLPLTLFTENFRVEDLGPTAFVLLLNSDGSIVYSSRGTRDKALLGKGFSYQRETSFVDLFGLMPHHDHGMEYSEVLDEDVILGQARVPATGWTVTTCLPEQTFFQGPRRFLLLGASLGGLALVISSLLARRLAGPIIANIDTTIRHTEEVAGGRLDRQLNIVSDDELQDLAQAINQMTMSIAHSTGEQQALTRILQSIIDPLLITDSQDRVITANSAARDLFGLSREGTIDRLHGSFFPGDPLLADSARLRERLASGTLRNHEAVLTLGGQDQTAHLLVSSSLVDSAHAEQSGIMTIVKDISQLKLAEERIQRMAFYDPLTLLPNRALLVDRMERVLFQARSLDDKARLAFAVLFMDLDRFKLINDTLGHTMGDQLLVAVAERLQDTLRKGDTISRIRPEDTIARLGGDEFVIMLQGSRQPRDVATVAQRILTSLATPFSIAGQQLYSPASIGISIFPDDGVESDALLKNADAAMYHAKAAGKNSYQFFSDSMNTQAKNRLQVENRLRQAVQASSGFVLYYQPKVDLMTGQVNSAEALVRWIDDELGFVPPLDFIPIAEDTGLILPLGEHILELACRQTASWRDSGVLDIAVAVNLSGRQMKQAGLEEIVAQCLRAHNLPADRLQIELTESSLIESVEHNLNTLYRLKELGATLAIDDFGTGYSSLAYLKRFPIDVLKIDRAFIKEMEPGSDDEAIVRATIAMAHSLKLKVVAEGVEEERHIDMLRDMGCEEVQGYFYSPPLPAEKFAAFVASRNGMPAPQAGTA